MGVNKGKKKTEQQEKEIMKNKRWMIKGIKEKEKEIKENGTGREKNKQ